MEMTWTREPRDAKQFVTKKAAVAAAVAIRFRRIDVREISIMGFRLWTVADDHGRMLTETGYSTIFGAVEAEYARKAGV